MISFEKFDKILSELKSNMEYLDKVCELVGNPDIVYEHAGIDELIVALASCFDGKDETEELLFLWVFEAEFGTEWDEEWISGWDVDLSTVEKLYTFLRGKCYA